MILTTDKSISLSPIELDDIEIIRKWRNNPNIQKYLREYRLFSKVQKKEWYLSMIQDNRFEMFLIKDNITSEPVGVCGLTYIDWVNRHADIHIYTGKDELWIDDLYCPAAMNLVLKYAFETLNLNKVWAEIYEVDNLGRNSELPITKTGGKSIKQASTSARELINSGKILELV